MKEVKTSCSDWHLSWGFGGNDHLGELRTEDGINFIWSGRRQGRHGQKIRTLYHVEFTEDNISGDMPARSEVTKAIEVLKKHFK